MASGQGTVVYPGAYPNQIHNSLWGVSGNPAGVRIPVLVSTKVCTASVHKIEDDVIVIQIFYDLFTLQL